MCMRARGTPLRYRISEASKESGAGRTQQADMPRAFGTESREETVFLGEWLYERGRNSEGNNETEITASTPPKQPQR